MRLWRRKWLGGLLTPIVGFPLKSVRTDTLLSAAVRWTKLPKFCRHFAAKLPDMGQYQPLRRSTPSTRKRLHQGTEADSGIQGNMAHLGFVNSRSTVQSRPLAPLVHPITKGFPLNSGTPCLLPIMVKWSQIGHELLREAKRGAPCVVSEKALSLPSNSVSS
jgi:hypothetical protein